MAGAWLCHGLQKQLPEGWLPASQISQRDKKKSFHDGGGQGERFGGLEPVGGEEDAGGQGRGCLQTLLFILRKTLLAHCLQHANLETVESLIRVFLWLLDFY